MVDPNNNITQQPFRFRLNCIDHYQATPTSLDPQFGRGTSLSQVRNGPAVPVIRVFGAIDTGQKVCAHIHGAFPYLYLEYQGDLGEKQVKDYIQTLALAINHALALSFRRNPFDTPAGTFVAHITLVKGVPFYGYHVGYRFFLKVYLRNPSHMTRFADLLCQGAILSRVFQPYESHLQYLLQWMCDYNLYGCGFIDCEKVRFRTPVPEFAELSTPYHHWHDRSIPQGWISDAGEFPRQSHCAIEVDVCVQDILNRRNIKPRDLHHDFSERFQVTDPDEKFVHSMAGLWKDETVRRKKRMGLADSDGSPFPPEVLISMSADPRLGRGNWIHEEEYKDLMLELVDREKSLVERRAINFDNFIQQPPEEVQVKTALDSVEDLFPENLRLENSNPNAAVVSLPPGQTDTSVSVDEDGNDQVEELIYDSDEDMTKEKTDDDPEERPNEGPEGGLAAERKHGPDRSATNTREFHRGASFNAGKVSTRELIEEELNVIKKRKLFHSSQSEIVNDDYQDLGKKTVRHNKTSNERRVKFSSDESSITKQDETPSASAEGTFSSSQLSQGSIKAQGIQSPKRFSFSVVKHPQERASGPRASQKSSLSNSDKNHGEAASSENFAGNTIHDMNASALSRSSTSLGSTSSNKLLQAATRLPVAFRVSELSKIRFFGKLPPSSAMVASTMPQTGRPSVIYQDAYYADENDVPDKAREYAGKEFKLESNTLPYLPNFDGSGSSPASFGEKPTIIRDKAKEELTYDLRRKRCTMKNWQISKPPPSARVVKEWVRMQNPKHSSKTQQRKSGVPPTVSQIDGPSQGNKGNSKYSKGQETSVRHETQYMSMMSLEVHVNSRGNLAPDPAEDEIGSVFWCVQTDNDDNNGNPYDCGIVVLSKEDGYFQQIQRQVSVQVDYEEDELDLLNRIIDIVRQRDPDVLVGYEVHNGSWGYLIERARIKFEYKICDEFSRMKSQSHGRFGKDADRWGFTHTSTIRITGRHMINTWRAMRGEMNLLQYTMENVAYRALNKRIPHYSYKDLTRWYRSKMPRHLTKVLNYFLSRAQLNLQILESNQIIARTSEQARILGVDFFSVISRGSQFKVESLMFRIAKPENYMLPSPSRKQVGGQNALECLPLVMEPQSNFYPSPLLVLDFQSLYPSVMIAYNYCYSTYLGRVADWRGQNKMGFTSLNRDPGLLDLVHDHVNIAPNGIMYVRPEIRKSLLAKMLTEILESRVMVKSGMKQDRDDTILQRLLDNRQLALKLIANVTYGYTSASFSGRMPCSEIADSIVQTARETLEKAIALIHSVEKWGAEVVYGDTDSLFIYLKGRTREEAFAIGKDIADTVTNSNPRPVKLKFEKVYHPCVLLAKKRYVGFKYESVSQKEPEFDAKGIETVRRDGTPAEQMIEEKALKILFRTQDLSEVKRYFQEQCAKIMGGRISIQDFLFAKEVKLGMYSDKGPPPPGALIATRRMLEDPRREPQYGERVPYLVIAGAPGARLIDRCVDPEVLLQDDEVELDAEYYISKNLIPPLERIFNLVGANVRSWYDEMPKVQRIRNIRALPNAMAGAAARGGSLSGIPKKTLENYLHNTLCLVCRGKLPPPAPGEGETHQDILVLPLCDECAAQPSTALLELKRQLHLSEGKARNIHSICRSCSGFAFGEEVACDSRDCPVFYKRIRENTAFGSLKHRVENVVRVLQSASFDHALEW